jgi:hypothetical protein
MLQVKFADITIYKTRFKYLNPEILFFYLTKRRKDIIMQRSYRQLKREFTNLS